MKITNSAYSRILQLLDKCNQSKLIIRVLGDSINPNSIKFAFSESPNTTYEQITPEILIDSRSKHLLVYARLDFDANSDDLLLRY